MNQLSYTKPTSSELNAALDAASEDCLESLLMSFHADTFDPELVRSLVKKVLRPIVSNAVPLSAYTFSDEEDHS